MRPVVLVGVDGSTADDIAIEWAVQEASMRALPLRIVHVANPPTLPRTIRADLANLALARSGAVASNWSTRRPRRHRPPRPASRSTRRCGPVVSSSSWSRQPQMPAYLWSVPGRGSTRLVYGWIGRHHVTAHAPCPVIVARTPAEGEPTTGPSAGRIVVGVDGSDVSVTAIGFAFDEASRQALSG